MKTDAELVALSHENFVCSFRKLGEHSPGGDVRESRSVLAFVSGVPLDFFNGCVVTGPASRHELETALEWVSSHAVPSRVWIAEAYEEGLADVPPAFGFGERAPHPGMVLHPIPERPAPAPGVTVEAVVGEASKKSFARVWLDGGLSPELTERLFPRSFVDDDDIELFVGRLDGRPVGTSLAIRSEGAGGVYAVGTLREARRRGVGTALTWAAVAATSAWGFETAVLQSSEMGYPVYTAMGFRTVSPYAMFSRASQAASGE